MKQKIFFGTILILSFMVMMQWSQDCSSFLLTKGASKDGSIMITYTCDGEFLPHLQYIPAQDHKPDEYIEIRARDGKIRGKIKQVAHTYAVVGLMNEYQLAIGETTFGGRKELRNPDGLLHYWTLMNLALQRAKTAREAIQVMADLVEEYGYASTGESFSIADPNEAWIMEMIGPGPGGKGAHWVALRIPDGYISAHANMSRIGEFPLNDQKNCIYSKNVISFAEQVVKRWRELGEYLLIKYNDGYVKDEKGRPREVGYPSEWLKEILKSKPDQFKLPKWGENKK